MTTACSCHRCDNGYHFVQTGAPGDDHELGADLDTLAGLDRVGELVAAGRTTQQAVIEAAAGALEPTYSIAAGVSLGLGSPLT